MPVLGVCSAPPAICAAGPLPRFTGKRAPDGGGPGRAGLGHRANTKRPDFPWKNSSQTGNTRAGTASSGDPDLRSCPSPTGSSRPIQRKPLVTPAHWPEQPWGPSPPQSDRGQAPASCTNIISSPGLTAWPRLFALFYPHPAHQRHHSKLSLPILVSLGQGPVFIRHSREPSI